MAVIAVVVANKDILLRRHLSLRQLDRCVKFDEEGRSFQDRMFYICFLLLWRRQSATAPPTHRIRQTSRTPAKALAVGRLNVALKRLPQLSYGAVGRQILISAGAAARDSESALRGLPDLVEDLCSDLCLILRQEPTVMLGGSRERHQQRHDHGGSCRIVTEVAPLAPPHHVADIGERAGRPLQELGEARIPAADKTPDQPECDKARDGVARDLVRGLPFIRGQPGDGDGGDKPQWKMRSSGSQTPIVPAGPAFNIS